MLQSSISVLTILLAISASVLAQSIHPSAIGHQTTTHLEAGKGDASPSTTAVIVGTTINSKLPRPTQHVASINLTTSLVDHDLLALEVEGQRIPLSCLNCSLDGMLHISGTELTWDSDLLLDDNKNVGFGGGLIDGQLPKRLRGHFELALKAPESLLHTFSLPDLALPGFAFPGLAEAGILVRIGMPISVELKEPAHLSFGFEFDLPKHSFLAIDVAEPHKSTIRGLENGNDFYFRTLPLNISEPNLDVKIATGLDFNIMINASLLDDDVDAEIGAQLQLPWISMSEQQLGNVDDKCRPLKHNTTKTTQDPSQTTSKLSIQTREMSEQLLSNYTRFVPSVGVDMNVWVLAGMKNTFAQKNVKFLDSTAARVFSTAFKPQTTCIKNYNTTSTSTTTPATTGDSHDTTSPPGGAGGTAQETSKANATSRAVRSIRHGESGDKMGFIDNNTALALTIALGILVISF